MFSKGYLSLYISRNNTYMVIKKPVTVITVGYIIETKLAIETLSKLKLMSINIEATAIIYAIMLKKISFLDFKMFFNEFFFSYPASC